MVINMISIIQPWQFCYGRDHRLDIEQIQYKKGILYQKNSSKYHEYEHNEHVDHVYSLRNVYIYKKMYDTENCNDNDNILSR